MMRPLFPLGVLLILSMGIVDGASAEAASRPPNIVIILADDQGWGDLSCNGNPNINTPHIDSLARDGARFDRFYVCPVCSPTRAEFLTGRYHPRGGVYSTSTGGERLDLDEVTMADLFEDAGYRTAAFGKWHNGMQYPYHPNARGFREYYGFCSGHWGQYFNPTLEHNGTLVRGKGFIIDDLTDHALAFIEANKETPFLCYLPFNTPHSPMQVPDEFYDAVPKAEELVRDEREPLNEDAEHTRAALAMCLNIDANVGRILKKLDELELQEETIVIYFSDNGPNGIRYNGGMRGRKGSTDEGGVRVPCMVRWTGHIEPGQVVPSIAGAIDLLPTLIEWTGISPAKARQFDGISLAPRLLGESKPDPDRLIFSHWSNRVSVRTNEYRLDHAGRLYDMVQDPGQTTDVADLHPDVTARLKRAVQDWRKEMLPGLTDDDRPFPVGYREFPTTHLPARDGVAHGGIQRSARAPNCSYFTHWTKLDDKITWDIEVATAGDYKAEVYYTCSEKNLGSKAQLSFMNSSVNFVFQEAHDPPLIGAKDDRVPRKGESYVKDFKPFSVGTMSLPKGRGLLTLQATEIAGEEVADIRYVVLTLQ